MRFWKTIIEKDFDSIENIIFGGDFNCPLNHAVDKRGGNIFPRRSVIAAIEQIQSELDVHNIWRIKNPTTRSYTWSQSEPLIFSRLNDWLISNSLSDNVSSVDIIPAIKTDHSAIVIVFQDLGNKAKGPGIWKFNCFLLSDNLYVEQINSLIPTWIQVGKKDLDYPSSVWEWWNITSKNSPESIKQTNVNKVKSRSSYWPKTFNMCSKYAKTIPLKKFSHFKFIERTNWKVL